MLCGTLTTRPNSAIAHARQFHIVVKHDFVDLIDEDFDAQPPRTGGIGAAS